jgi:Double zinc ribbon
MICTFCGTDNREANRFCGMCGVRLERRKIERRAQQDTSLKCESCGHVNEPGYKFCGMCGTRVERRMSERRGAAASVQSRTGAAGSVAVAVPDLAVAEKPVIPQVSGTGKHPSSDVLPQPRTSPVVRGESREPFRTERAERTGIQGPSFLGLSDEPEDETAYLLEEENSSRSGLRKLVLLVILAAIIGLIFIQYRSSLHANPKPAEPSHFSPQGQNPDNPAKAAPQQQNQAAPSTPDGNTAQSSASPAVPDRGSQAANGTDPTSPGAAKAENLPPAALDPASITEKAPETAEKTSGSSSPEKASPEKALDATVPAEQKPSAMLIRAQQFLHGSGVEQNCEQGLLYLRAAAQRNEPAAAVQMGALYASGHCVHQDRVMAYRWFNSAHELQPANQWILKNMDFLWGQMTEQERRLAGY